MIQAESKAERIALLAPVPRGQNGSTDESPTQCTRNFSFDLPVEINL